MPARPQFAVIGVFLEGGDEHEDNAALAPVFAAASTSTRFSQAFSTAPVAVPLNLAAFLPEDYDSKFYTYAGSLTTPPCWQQVTWFNAENTLKVSTRQLEQLRRVTTTVHQHDPSFQALLVRRCFPTAPYGPGAPVTISPRVIVSF
jgi:carbonic anhydrase